MTEHSRKLTLFEAAAVVAGLGFGGGVMAVPYLASLNGILELVLTAVVAYGFSMLLHLMVVEVVLREDKPQQLVEMFGKYVFKQTWWGKTLTWVIFALVLVTFYALLAGYIVGCADTDRLSEHPVAAGLEAIAVGYSLRFPDDKANLERQFEVYDSLYAWCRLQAAKA